MKKAKLILDKDYVISEIDPRVYGSFVEHLGRCVYTGIYEPGHPQADEEGFRKDVLDLVRSLNVPIVRYPGGNFVSGFNWEDSIGPKEQRPKRLDLAWKTTEPNEVGIHEFTSWAKKAGADVMYAVNLGTRGPADAQRIVEYANHKSGSELSDLRIKNGAKEPFDIRLWCLGNEMDGPWQTCHRTAMEYGRVANEASKMMKWTDDRIETVACGSSHFRMPTFGEWEYTVLSECYENVDYISLHRYYGNPTGDTPDFLASSMDLDAFIKTVASICDSVRGKLHSKKQVNLSLDEWNVWYHSGAQDQDLYKTEPWGTALPLLEDIYNFEDALLVGLILITILKNADRVKVACMAQLVNVIAPIMTRKGGGAWAQTSFWPLMHASTLGRGKSLQPVLTGDKQSTASWDDVPFVDAAAVLQDNPSNLPGGPQAGSGGQRLVIFAVNRSLDEPAELSLDLRSFGKFSKAKHTVLHHDDLKAVNTEDAPNNVCPAAVQADAAEFNKKDGKVILPAASWNVIELS